MRWDNKLSSASACMVVVGSQECATRVGHENGGTFFYTYVWCCYRSLNHNVATFIKSITPGSVLFRVTCRFWHHSLQVGCRILENSCRTKQNEDSNEVAYSVDPQHVAVSPLEYSSNKQCCRECYNLATTISFLSVHHSFFSIFLYGHKIMFISIATLIYVS